MKVKSESQRREEGKTDEPRVAYETSESITYHEGDTFYKQYKLPFGVKNEQA
jgi:hypothetical protein